ncbi:retinoschisin-like [Clavelina lepadiformis]|uniref:retinoschisin-like n=1 Tax=Clavelina lepadiformis TaxID=159417 RepID=UPI004042213E
MLSLSCMTFVLVVPLISGHSDEICLTLNRCNDETRQSPESTQGPPGRRGAVGLPGPVGPSGEPGYCVGNEDEVNELREEMRQLNDQVAKLTSITQQMDKVTFCSVGLRDGRVQNEDITASSIHNEAHSQLQGRLDHIQQAGHAGGWVPLRLTTSGEWIQVDLRTPAAVTGVVTQGRSDYDGWVTSYKVSYGNSTNQMHVMQQNRRDLVFYAYPQNSNTHVTNMFPISLAARYWRLIAQTWHKQIALRFELLTC